MLSWDAVVVDMGRCFYLITSSKVVENILTYALLIHRPTYYYTYKNSCVVGFVTFSYSGFGYYSFYSGECIKTEINSAVRVFVASVKIHF